ncbi:MAG: malectin domain-containing carbohydrate-binding protein [bacterium]
MQIGKSQKESRALRGVLTAILFLIITVTMTSADVIKEKDEIVVLETPIIPAVIPAVKYQHGEWPGIANTPVRNIIYNGGVVRGIGNCKLSYDILAAKAGNYAITLNIASIISDLSMRVQLDDVDVTGKLLIPNTGSWKKYTDVTSKKVVITAGKHIIKVIWDETPGINFLLPRLASIKIDNYKPLAIRINAGDYMDYTDSKGNVWQPDTGFADGECVERGEGVIIKNSKDVRIYRTEHFGMSRFSLKVPNGNYIARLHFAETFDDRRPGSRIFKINVNGTEFPKFDLIGEAGGCYRALIKTVPITVINGEFYITFSAPNMPSVTINGIELLETETLPNK